MPLTWPWTRYVYIKSTGSICNQLGNLFFGPVIPHPSLSCSPSQLVSFDYMTTNQYAHNVMFGYSPIKFLNFFSYCFMLCSTVSVLASIMFLTCFVCVCLDTGDGTCRSKSCKTFARVMKSTKVQNPRRKCNAVVETNCLVAEYRIGPHTIITHVHRAPLIDKLGHATWSATSHLSQAS